MILVSGLGSAKIKKRHNKQKKKIQFLVENSQISSKVKGEKCKNN